MNFMIQRNKNALRRLVLASAVAAAALAGAGCASTGTAASQAPEAHVAQLANQRWSHLIAGEWKKAYDMITPGYRSLHDLREYQSQFKGAVHWKKAEVATTACESDKCEVRIKLTVASPFGRGKADTISTFFNETWLKEGGRWYYYEKP